MKEQRLEILRKVGNGELMPEEADEKLLGLSIVGISLPSGKQIADAAQMYSTGYGQSIKSAFREGAWAVVLKIQGKSNTWF